MRVVDYHVFFLGEDALVAVVKGCLGLLQQVLLEHVGDLEELRVIFVEDLHERVLMCFYCVAADDLLDAVEDVVVEKLLLFDVDVLHLSENGGEVVDQPLPVAQIIEFSKDCLLFGLQLHTDVEQVVVVDLSHLVLDQRCRVIYVLVDLAEVEDELDVSQQNEGLAVLLSGFFQAKLF